MAKTMTFRIGADASCTDGACGQVSRIIVNPVTREVTHLAVDPKHRHGPGRLVPVDLVDATTGQIRLRCPLAEFQTLRPAQETEGRPDLDSTGHGHGHPDNAPNKVNWVVADGSVIMQPGGRGEPEAPQQVTVDSVPEGEVEVHRELTVCATDGDIGQVQGLVVEPGGHHVTHVLLQEGHMRGRKEVAIPIGAVTKIGTLLIHLSLTKHQVKDLPPVDIDHLSRGSQGPRKPGPIH
jgi:sporulation protein YlmC with PRC-barrel domain